MKTKMFIQFWKLSMNLLKASLARDSEGWGAHMNGQEENMGIPHGTCKRRKENELVSAYAEKPAPTSVLEAAWDKQGLGEHRLAYSSRLSATGHSA